MTTATITTGSGKSVTTDVETLERLARTVRAEELPPTTAPAADSDTAAARRRELAAQIHLPSDDDFGEDDFLDSPAMNQLVAQLIEDWPELGHIRQTRVTCSWKRKATKSRGKIAAGKCTPLSGYAKYRAGADFHIWLAADAVRDAAYGPYELEAMLFHECCHIGYEVDENPDSPTYGEIKAKGIEHDFAGFFHELLRYPRWHQDLRQAENTFEQLKLGIEAA